MQVFILDNDVGKNCGYYMDKHVVKIPVEIAQILSTTLRVKGYNSDGIYKSTHIHHPWVKWCCESWDNFDWLLKMGSILCGEYKTRYNKDHKSFLVIWECYRITISIFPTMSALNHTPFPLCMPDQYKTDDVVQSYRNYYIAEKSHIAKWKNRPIPEWFPKQIVG